jgi:tryptophan halogenase
MADSLDLARTRKELDEMEQSIRFLVENMPGHGEYLAKYCPTQVA